METLLSVLQIQIFNNPLESYLLFLLIFLGLSLAVKIVRRYFFKWLRDLNHRWGTHINDNFLAKSEQLIFPVLYAGVFYFSLKQLTLNPALDKVVQSLLVIVFCIQGIRLILMLVLHFLEKMWFANKSTESVVSKSILTLVRITVWSLGFVFLLNNLGFNVTAIVAGLGIGGIAVALAAQTILGDLFNYFVILLDKPFREGDFIVAGDFMGEIENIGIKSTRLRSLGGEELVISNSNLTSNYIHNYKRMNRRRIEFSVTASHRTSLEQLKEIPGLIAKIIQGNENTQLDRSHFKAITDTGLVLEAVYFVNNADFNKYMDIQQKINFEIKDAFEKRGIAFAQANLINEMTVKMASSTAMVD